MAYSLAKSTMIKGKNTNKGFTLIEILVVIGIIAILAAVVLVAINPARQFAQARDSQRASNVNAIINAIGQYIADNRGNYPPSIITGGVSSTTKRVIGSATTTVGLPIPASSQVNLCADLVPTYLSAFPTDPSSLHKGGTIEAENCYAYDSGYMISTTTQNRVIIWANGEATSTISVTR